MVGRLRSTCLIAVRVLLVTVVAFAAVVISGCSGGSETPDTHATVPRVSLPPPAADAPTASEVFEGPGALVLTFRRLSQRLLNLGDEGAAARRRVCERVSQAIDEQVDQAALVEAAAGVAEPVLAELLLDERATRRDLLEACESNDRAATDRMVDRARLIDELIDQRLDQLS